MQKCMKHNGGQETIKVDQPQIKKKSNIFIDTVTNLGPFDLIGRADPKDTLKAGYRHLIDK